jgi:predicted nucleic acid-binding protein
MDRRVSDGEIRVITVLLDLNVLLDAFLGREPWRAEADAIWDANREGRIGGRVSAAGLPTLFYVIRKQEDLARAHLAVANCLRSLEIVPVGRATLEMATTLPGSDFEDNLHITCAVEARLDAIVTRNAIDFVGSPIPVLTPAELLGLLAKAPST